MTGLYETKHDPAGWCMARRRGVDRYRPFALAAAGILATFLLAGAIQLGNSITALRHDVQDLARDYDNLEAHQAQLAVRWNTVSSRQVVMRRAQTELKLVCPDVPGTIIVATAEVEEPGSTWARLWPRLSRNLNNPLPSAVAGENSP